MNPDPDLGASPGPDPVSGGHEILRRIATYSPGTVLPAALTLATSMIFTRLFTAEEYGAFSLAFVVATMVKTGLSNWLTLSIAKFLPPELEPHGQKRVKDAILLTTFLMLSAEFLAGLLALALASSLLDAQDESFVVPAILYVVTTSVYGALSAVLAAEHRAAEYVTYQLIVSVVTFGLRMVLVSTLFAGDISIMFWSLAVANGLLVPILWVRAGLLAPTPGHLWAVMASHTTRRLSWGFVAFGLPMTMWLVASVLMDVGDRFVIESMLGSAAVGAYDANYRLISGSVSLMIAPISMTLYPYLMSISGTGAPEHVGRVIGVIVENLMILGTLAVGLTWIFEGELALLLGPEFREGSVIMPIVLAGVFACDIGTYAHKPFEVVGRTRQMVILAFVAAALNILLNYALIPLIGYLGAACATLASYVMYAVSVGTLGRRVIPWRIDARTTAVRMFLTALGVSLILGLRLVVGQTTTVSGLIPALVASALLASWVLTRIRRAVLAVPAALPARGQGGNQ